MTAILEHLRNLYAHTDDPWNFADSKYEQDKFTATRNALTQNHYDAAFELGCGNGALASRLAPICKCYIGMDAIERAVIAARSLVPTARFIHGCYPCTLPDERFDLIVLSEILYFLAPEEIVQLAQDLGRLAPTAEILCISYLGNTEMPLQGVEAFDHFRRASRTYFEFTEVAVSNDYRIDRGNPCRRA